MLVLTGHRIFGKITAVTLVEHNMVIRAPTPTTLLRERLLNSVNYRHVAQKVSL